MNREAEFSRLLRWYPRQWRAEHGPVLVGTMMDAATAEGRDRPTAAERRSAAMHGLGARFNERFALVSAASATALAVIGLVAFVMGLQGISQVPLALVPWLSVLAAIALLRSTSALPGPLTVAIAALTTLAFALGFTAALSWSIAFDAADDGVAGTWFSDALLLWVTAAWVTGAAATALLAGGLLSTTRLPAAARISAAIAQLQRQRVFALAVTQKALPVAMQQRTGGDHLGVEQGLLGQQAQKEPAMPICPVHHRCNGETPRRLPAQFAG